MTTSSPRAGDPAELATIIDLRQLAAAASHEIRNPLNTMAIHCELLESRLSKLPAEVPEREAMIRSVATLTAEVQRVDSILERFLIHAGPEEAERVPVVVEGWLDQVMALGQPAAQARGVRLVLRKGRISLPRWHVDAVTLGRALQAVIDNAVGASGPGQEVTVTASCDDEHARIEVADQGPGIPADQLAQVCHVGFTTRPGHAGLGLAIVKQVVKAQHGGDLRIDSRAGGGTRVTLIVPLDDEI